MPSEWGQPRELPTNAHPMETYGLRPTPQQPDCHPKSAHFASSSGPYEMPNRCMMSCVPHTAPHMSQPIYHEENVKADTTDWDSAATLAALSATTNHQNTAGLLAELNSSAGEWQPSMSTGVAGDAYSNLRIKFVDQEVHRTVTDPATCITENEVSNLRPFKLTIAVCTLNGEPPPVSHLMLKVSLVVESPDAGVQAVQPFLSQEDARSPLLVGMDGSPAQAVPVKPDGFATFTLKLGKNALSSKVNNRRFSLLVQLDLPVEQLANLPNLMVLSPPFKGLTRLRLRAGDARADRLAVGLDSNGGQERLVEDDQAHDASPVFSNAPAPTAVKRSQSGCAPSVSDLHQLLIETRRIVDQQRQENAELRERICRLEDRLDGRVYKHPRQG